MSAGDEREAKLVAAVLRPHGASRRTIQIRTNRTVRRNPACSRMARSVSKIIMHSETNTLAENSAIRNSASLSGLWDFAFLGPVDPDSIQPNAVSATEKMPVPSAFDALPAHAGKRGVALYRTSFTLAPNHPARLEFGAVSMRSLVFIDGVLQREHACGYSPFSVDVPPSNKVSRELSILVDNRFDFKRAPMHEEYFDFYQYGGILRDVVLHQLPKEGPFIDIVHVLPTAGYREGNVEARIYLGGDASGPVIFTTQFDNEPAQTHSVAFQPGEGLILSLQVSHPQIWSPQSPKLHVLRVTLLESVGIKRDATEVRFGLRLIEAHAGQLWLNGEKLRLRGFNRHEWHPNYGPCTPALQMAADLQWMRKLGCNFVRGSHYPQDQRFLDLCDEMGFLVWEENLGWGQREKVFASETFRRQHRESLEAMVRASINHPSVIIWGFLNEAGSNEDYVRPVFEETAAKLRAMDPSRLISFASMFSLDDRNFDLVDLIALNVYPGWYGAEGVEDPCGLIAPFMQKCFASIDARGFGDKPVIISEIGAEALYGWRDPHDDFFTESYQAKYLAEACREALENPRSSGIAIWHFSDVRTYGGGRSLLRPRAFNNKGVFDEYRRPKASADAVGMAFSRHR